MTESNQPNYSGLFFLLILIIGFGIYWFGVRPEQQRNQCKAEASEWADEYDDTFAQGSGLSKQIDKVRKNSQIYGASYEGCLKNKGLK